MKLITILEQKDNNQITFYANKLGTILRSFEGFEYADVRQSIDDVAGDYGAVYITSKHGIRRVSIQGDLISSDVYTLRRQLNKAVRQTGQMKLFKFTTYDDLALQFEAEVVKMVNPYVHTIHQFLIEAIAPDWRFYAQTEKSYDVAQTFVRGGFAIPATIPLAITESAPSGDTVNKIVVNDGNEVTDPVFTITGPGTNFTIGNDTTGKEFLLTQVLVGGDTVVIDVKARTVVLNGTDNLYSAISGDFWSVVPGENELRFFVNSGLTTETNLNIAYRDAYGGI